MKITFPFSFVSQLSIPLLPFFLSSYFHLHIFAHHSLNVAHTVGDGCAWCGRWRRQVSSARATGPGAGERVTTQHVPHMAPLARVLWHTPQVPLLSNPPQPTLTPTCCSCSLTAGLSDAGLRQALPATQSSTSHHLDPALTTRQKLLSQRSPETEMQDRSHFLSPPLP